jgi:hypothetical protein
VTRSVWSCALLVCLAGCTPQRGPFTYEHPPSHVGHRWPIAAYRPIVDGRRDHSIDAVYDGSPVAALGDVLGEELGGAGLFGFAMAQPDAATAEELRHRGVGLLVEPTLKVLEWDVPDYDGIRQTLLLWSAFTLGIGGFVYGGTDTDVHGRTVLVVRLTDVAAGSATVERRYEGKASETRTKLNCDTGATRRAVVQASAKAAMRQLVADLQALAGR